jgi:hypothetical protein
MKMKVTYLKYYLSICVSCLLSMATMASPSPKELNVPFKLVKGLIVIEVEFENKLGNFIFDTGAEDLLVDLEYTSGEKVEFSSLNGTITTFKTEIRNVALGNIRKKKVDAYVTNLKAIETFLDMEIEGIMGCNFFIPNSVIIDFEKGKLRITEKEIIKENMWQFNQLEFKFSTGLPVVEVVVNHKTHLFYLDSGATSHFIDTGIVDEFPDLFTKTGEVVDIITASTQKHSVEKVSSSDLILGVSALKSGLFCPKDFSEFNRHTDENISGIISLTQLSTRYLAIDLKRNVIYY